MFSFTLGNCIQAKQWPHFMFRVHKIFPAHKMFRAHKSVPRAKNEVNLVTFWVAQLL